LYYTGLWIHLNGSPCPMPETHQEPSTPQKRGVKSAKKGGGQTAASPPNATPPNLFLWGVGGLLLSIAIVFSLAKIQPIQAAVVACLVGLSGAAIATGISGILKFQTKMLTASGPVVVFILAFWAVMSTGAPGVFPDLISALTARVPVRRQ
jgi:hypothetical protein